MDFGWEPELEEFRSKVRAWAREFNTPEVQKEVAAATGEEGFRAPIVKRIKDETDRMGWLKLSWPPEMGGAGKSPWYGYILTEELQKAGLPPGDNQVSFIAPAILRFGTEEQKAKYLPGLWSGEISCALGYSEPNAGTDLASLETTARRDGDDWVINGQKLWTSTAHISTHVWLAVRTDPKAPKHRGISMFIVPLNTPGITVRPVWTMAGARTNETFYEDVRVPNDALIGEEGRGWYVAANALDHERINLGGGPGLQLWFEDLMRYLKQHRPELLEDRKVRLRLAELKVDIHNQRALRLTNAAIVAEGGTPTMQASMVKVVNSELRYRMSSLVQDLLGQAAILSGDTDGGILKGMFEQAYRASPILRFGGGTNEVQRNIVAQRGLGLPR